MKTTLLVLTVTVTCAAPVLHAGPRSSAIYALATDSVDSAGGRAASAAYMNDGSAGGITGISTVAVPDQKDKAGYIAQLFEPAGLSLTAPSSTVNEATTLQLGGVLTLDDGTTLVLPPASITWDVASVPITGISASGLLTAGSVFQDSLATAQGSYAGLPGALALTVLDILPDNYDAYAGDGLPDLWQVGYFGIGNPAAAPAQDPDGDGYGNLFEYNACLVPTNALSVFAMSIIDLPGGGHAVQFSPRLSGCSYDLQGSSGLTLWEHVTGTITDDGRIRTITDPAGHGPRRFYRVMVKRN